MGEWNHPTLPPMDWVEQAYIPSVERSGIRGDEGLGAATREGGGRRPCMGVPAPCRYRGLGRCGRWMGVPCVFLDGRGHLPPLSGLAADPRADPIEEEVRPMAGKHTSH